MAAFLLSLSSFLTWLWSRFYRTAHNLTHLYHEFLRPLYCQTVPLSTLGCHLQITRQLTVFSCKIKKISTKLQVSEVNNSCWKLKKKNIDRKKHLKNQKKIEEQKVSCFGCINKNKKILSKIFPAAFCSLYHKRESILLFFTWYEIQITFYIR